MLWGQHGNLVCSQLEDLHDQGSLWVKRGGAISTCSSNCPERRSSKEERRDSRSRRDREGETVQRHDSTKAHG